MSPCYLEAATQENLLIFGECLKQSSNVWALSRSEPIFWFMDTFQKPIDTLVVWPNHSGKLICICDYCILFCSYVWGNRHLSHMSNSKTAYQPLVILWESINAFGISILLFPWESNVVNNQVTWNSYEEWIVYLVFQSPPPFFLCLHLIFPYFSSIGLVSEIQVSSSICMKLALSLSYFISIGLVSGIQISSAIFLVLPLRFLNLAL